MLKVGIIGAGAMGKMHFKAYSYIKNAEVAAISDYIPENAKAVIGNKNIIVYNTPEELINDSGVDVVDICLPTAFHKKYTVMAAQKGIHVLCEKPMALNTEDAQEMIDAARSSGIVLMIGHCMRFSKAYGLLKDSIESKQYGELLSLNIYRHSPVPSWSEGNWLADRTKSGGLAIDLHIHDVDMVYYLLGKPQAVTSYGNNVNFTTLYEFPGKTVSTEASWRPQTGYPFNTGYDAVFEKASIIHKDYKITIYEGNENPIEIDEIEQAALDNKIIPTLKDKLIYLYIDEIKYFLKCIEMRLKPTKLLPEDCLKVLDLTLKEITSSIIHEKIII